MVGDSFLPFGWTEFKSNCKRVADYTAIKPYRVSISFDLVDSEIAREECLIKELDYDKIIADGLAIYDVLINVFVENEGMAVSSGNWYYHLILPADIQSYDVDSPSAELMDAINESVSFADAKVSSWYHATQTR